jgi:hypothetical protein
MNQGEYLHAKQNQFDANDMCLPLGEYFLFFLHSTHMSNTNEKNGQRFILEAPNHNLFSFEEHFFPLDSRSPYM